MPIRFEAPTDAGIISESLLPASTVPSSTSSTEASNPNSFNEAAIRFRCASGREVIMRQWLNMKLCMIWMMLSDFALGSDELIWK